MTYFLILTALTVSIDSFVCGFSLSFLSKKKFSIVTGIAITVFLMCLITNYATKLLSDYVNEQTASLGGLILIFIGLFNLIKNKNDGGHKAKDKGIISQILCVGFAVGLDGALANLSLSLMGINEFYVPLTIAVCHALMIFLGIVLSQTPIAKKFGKIEWFSPIILIMLGGYKLLGLFI